MTLTPRSCCCRMLAGGAIVTLLGGCAAIGAIGARSAHESAPTAGTSTAFTPSPGSDLLRVDLGGAVRIVDLSFDVFRADLPLSRGRDSRKIWNHVDEMRMDTGVTTMFARNGLRVGVAPIGSWTAIQAVLETMRAKTYKSMLAPPRGAPLMITTGPVSERESVFTYAADGRLVGKTFSEGDKLISLDYVFQPQFGGSTELQVGFEVRHDKGVMTWTRDGGVIRQVPAYERHVFADLVARLTVDSGECLVIGPGDEARIDSLIGGRYLSIEHDGEAYESLLFITPVPYQTKGGA